MSVLGLYYFIRVFIRVLHSRTRFLFGVVSFFAFLDHINPDVPTLWGAGNSPPAVQSHSVGAMLVWLPTYFAYSFYSWHSKLPFK